MVVGVRRQVVVDFAVRDVVELDAHFEAGLCKI